MNDDKRYYQQSYQQMIIVHFLYKLEYQAELIKEEKNISFHVRLKLST
jgi:hypothetical protein